MEAIHAVFAKVAARYEEQRPAGDGLRCRQGFYGACPVLKLLKAAWTNDRIDALSAEHLKNTSGIFFSIWVDAEAARARRAHYNVHALKLRELAGHQITSRDFAGDFRRGFAGMAAGWPNVGVEYGPLTLMQGWMEIELERFEQDVVALMERFEGQVSPLIDGLLGVRRKS